MPNYTTNLNLIKPIVTELYDISKVTNDNADILDAFSLNKTTYKGTLALITDLPVSANTGDIYYVTENSYFYLYDGSSFLAFGGGSISADIVSFTPYGNLSSTDVQNVVQELDDEKATTENYTATLASTSWTGTEAPFSKAVTVAGIVSTDTPIIDLVLTGTYATDVLITEDWGLIYDFDTSTNTITFYAHEVPSVDLPFHAKVVR